jgi:hypothetical protein
MLENTKKIKAGVDTFTLSAKIGEGFENWLDWLKKEYQLKSNRKH